MNKVLITGASGQLGKSLLPLLYKKYNNIKILKSRLENIKELAIEVKEFDPDLIIHLGAWTDVDGCALNINRSFLINYVSTQVLIDNSRTDTVFVFVSTDYVFSGDKGLYYEWAAPNPVNIYGYHKYLSELYLQENKKSFYIVRAHALYYGQGGSGFVERVENALRQGKTLNLPQDEFVSPTFTEDFSQFILKVLNQKPGIYHGTGPDYLDKYQVGLYVASFFKLDYKKINPVYSLELKRPAFRPKLGGLSSTRLYFKFRPLREILNKLSIEMENN